MADEEYLPPIVMSVLFDDEEALTGLAGLKSAEAETAASMDESTAAMSASASAASADIADAADASIAASAEMGKAQEDAAAASSDAAAEVHDASGNITDDLTAAGAGAAASGESTKGALEDTGDAAQGAADNVHDASSSMVDDLTSAGAGAAAGADTTKGALNEVDKSASKTSSMLEKLGKDGALAAVGFAGASVDIAAKLQKNEKALETSLQVTGEGTLAQHRSSIEQTEAAMIKYGKTPGETVKSLSLLTTASKSLTVAESDLGIAADYAARKHVSLEAAAGMLAKVYSGTPGRAIKELGINLPQGTGKLGSLETAQQAVEAEKRAKKLQETELEGEAREGKITPGERQEKEAIATEKLQRAEEKLQKDREAIPDVFKAISAAVAGEAAKQAQTVEGQAEVVKSQLDALMGNFGKAALPVMIDAEKVLAGIVGWLVRGGPAAKVVEVAVAGIATALVTVYGIKKVVGLFQDIQSGIEAVAGKFGLIGPASEAAAAEVTAADGEMVVDNEAVTASFLEMIAPLAEVAAGIGVFIGAAEGMSRLLGKGSFIDNVKELISGDKGLHEAEHEEVVQEGHHLTAEEKLLKAQREHPKTAARMQAEGAYNTYNRKGGGLHIDKMDIHGSDMTPHRIADEMYKKARPLLQG